MRRPSSLIHPTGPESRHARQGNAIGIVLFVLASLVAAGVYFGPTLLSKWTSSGDSAWKNALTHTVRRGNLIVTVADDGELQSASNVDIKCEIAGGSTILWIIPDGTVVEAKQEIVKLDSSGIEEQLAAQTGIYKKAEAAQIKANEDFEAAKIAVQEYIEGTYVKNLQEVESLITIAKENMRSAENVLQHTQRMSRKGFATPLQVEADKFAVERAELDLKFAETSKDVLQRFTKKKMTRGLEATRDAAKALKEAELAAVELEKSKLEKLTKQLEKCVIFAPKAGMVVYYAERSRYGSSNSQIEEGAQVRERQTLIQLPDLTQMQAKVPVHESEVDQIVEGQLVHLRVLDREFKGRVTSIANQPESKSFFSAKVKEYPAEILIIDDCEGLRPGMTAEVEILIANLQDVLTIPVSAVVVKGDTFYGYVMTPEGPEKRNLLLGMSNHRYVEVKDGVAEGEDILMNPRAVIGDQLNEDDDGDKQDKSPDATDRFGEGGGAVSPPTTPRAGSGGQGSSSSGNKSRSFSDFDKNKDGQLTSDEVPNPKMIERLDKDKDGSISASEYASRQARPSGRQGNGGQPGTGAG